VRQKSNQAFMLHSINSLVVMCVPM
jgi:hypothetical protein